MIQAGKYLGMSVSQSRVNILLCSTRLPYSQWENFVTVSFPLWQMLRINHICWEETRQYVDQPLTTFLLKSIKLSIKSAPWKSSPGSPAEFPQSHFHIHHRHKQGEASYSDVPVSLRHFYFKTILVFHLGTLVQMMLVQKYPSGCSHLYPGLVSCRRNTSKPRNRIRILLPSTLLYYIFLTLEFPWRIFTNSFILFHNQKYLIFICIKTHE